MNMNDTFRFLHLGLPLDVERLRGMGDLNGAVAAIDRHLADPSLLPPMRHSLTAHREMLLRYPFDYPLTRTEALALVRQHIPDFSEAEFDALERDRFIDWTCLQGEKRYFDRFFENLCKTNADIAARAGIAPVGADGHDNQGLLEQALSTMREQGRVSARIRCRASVRMKDPVFRKGERVRVYLPLPCACAAQTDIKIEAVSPAPTHISPENAPQRVLFWEEVMEENHPFTVEFSYTRTAEYVDLSHPDRAEHRPRFDTEEVPSHLMFTPYIRALVNELTDGVDEPLEQARKFYDFITCNVKYALMPAYFSLENIPDRCARDLRGDCGMMALLFVTMCRCAGIPARWESGWKAEPGLCGAHDWAQFYVEPYGWLYADLSYGCGAHREGNEARRQHYFGNLDPFRMAANTQFQADFDVPKLWWRADPYDNQVGEMETDRRGLCYDAFLRSKEVLDFRLL